jgi:hypothetical protein
MLRWICLSAVLCAIFVSLGLGEVVPLASGVQSFFLAMAALSGTVLVSSYDAYETQAIERDD